MEKMSDFFTARIEEYDQHMLSNVEGCKEAYEEMAHLVPKSCQTLLDLGCGTGLELDQIFRFLPQVHVTGIDLTQAMLDKLKEKHPEKNIRLICGNYFDIPFGREQFDCVVSFQTMHHFSHRSKENLYQKIVKSLKENGIYIECDYMVERQEEEDFHYAENARIRKEFNLSPQDLYHYDTPCTVQNQIKLLKKAGFFRVEQTFRAGNTTILFSEK